MPQDSEGFEPIDEMTPRKVLPMRPPPKQSAIAEMAAHMQATAESSYTESVIQELVAIILDEKLDSLERAEAVVALKSYLQADWDEVARHVGVTGRSLQVIAGIIKLKESFKESLQTRRIGLRHGAALVRLADQDVAAERLHTWLLKHPDVGGEEALRVAGLMVRQPELDPDRARRQLGEDVRRRLLLRGMSDPDLAPARILGAGLRQAVDALAKLDATTLSREQRAELSRDLTAALTVVERLQNELDSLDS